MNFDRVIAERKFRTIYGDGDKTISVFEKETFKSKVFSEALHTARVEEDGYSVPKVLDIVRVEDKWAIVSESFEGKFLYDLMVENPEKMDEYLDILTKALKDLGNIIDERFRPITDRIDVVLNKTGLTAVERFQMHTYISSLPTKRRVLHTDLNPKNVIVKEDGGYYVVDWRYAAKGHPAFDYAFSYLTLTVDFGSEVADRFLDKIAPTEEEKQKVRNCLAPAALHIIYRQQFSDTSAIAHFTKEF